MVFLLIVMVLVLYLFGVGVVNMLANTALIHFGLPTLDFGTTLAIILAIYVVKVLVGGVSIGTDK